MKDSNKPILLVVDDDKDVLGIIKYDLSNMECCDPFTIISAEDGLEALKIIEKESSVAFILSDINMPNMNGIEFAKTLAKREFNIPLVFLTAHGDADTMRAVNEVEYDALVRKPYDRDSLAAAIEKALSERTSKLLF